MLLKGVVKTWWSVGVLLVLASLAAGGPQEDSPKKSRRTAAEALALFEKEWKPRKGYMRPLDDSGWRARLEAFRDLVRLGDKAVPVLTEALGKGEPETRTFAAQALTFLADPAARPALEKAVEDSHPAVRLYAIDALSMFGRLKESEQYRQIREKDPNRDVRSHMAFALERDDKPQPAAIQKTLLDYDMAGMDTAKLGKPAPDFTLTDATGKTYRLRDFRGKKEVVLVFIYGDTWPVCHGQLAQLRDRIKDFEDRGVQVLAVDPHESYRVRHMLRDVGLKADAVAFPVLADPANTVSATYGMAFQMNIHTELSNRPATFIIDKEGVIRYERRGKTFGDRPKPDEILKELDRLTGR